MPKAKAAREKLAPIPTRKRRPPEGREQGMRTAHTPDQPPAGPDLSHITPGLRALAVPIGDLHFHPTNPRTHDEKNIAAIRASLRVNGQYRAAVASTRTGQLVLVVGNGMLAAALAEGWTHLAVEPMALSEARENQLMVMDNETASLASWSQDALLACMRDMDTANDPDMDACIAGLAEAEKLLPKEESVKAEELPDKWEVVVSCGNEDKQKQLYDRLTGEGLECRVLTF